MPNFYCDLSKFSDAELDARLQTILKQYYIANPSVQDNIYALMEEVLEEQAERQHRKDLQKFMKEQNPETAKQKEKPSFKTFGSINKKYSNKPRDQEGNS